jgi:Spy/CpxP family protein refolding chaperone
MVPALSIAQTGHTPYAGQEQRDIKALSGGEIAALLKGEGIGFAKAAELNHYPGPRHILDMVAQLRLCDTQRAEAQHSYDRMHTEAVCLGDLIIARERDLDRLFARGEIDEKGLQQAAREIAQLQGELRIAHLQAHLEMKQLLSPDQLEQYDELRGYTGSGNARPHSDPPHGRH